MKTKFNFSREAIDYNKARLINQVFKLLPMYEKEEYWEAQRDTVVLDLRGYNAALKDSPDFMNVVGKLAALEFAQNKEQFRKIVFEAITALKEV